MLKLIHCISLVANPLPMWLGSLLMAACFEVLPILGLESLCGFETKFHSMPLPEVLQAPRGLLCSTVRAREKCLFSAWALAALLLLCSCGLEGQRLAGNRVSRLRLETKVKSWAKKRPEV